MKNVVLKTCMTSLVLSMSGLAAAANQQFDVPFTADNFYTDYTDYSAIAGAALSVAAGSCIEKDVAAQAAVTIGADARADNLYAGAAVTVGADAVVKNIYAGAAAGVAANAKAENIYAGAAVTLGAPSDAHDIEAGAAITLGASSTAYDVHSGAATTGATVRTVDENDGIITLSGNVNSLGHKEEVTELFPFEMQDALERITAVQGALNLVGTSDNNGISTDINDYVLGTYMGSATEVTELAGGVYEASALNMPASATIKFTGDAIINLSDALTLGADTTIVVDGGHKVIWNVGGALNLGAGTSFAGTAFVNGSISGATSDVQAGGQLFAQGAVAIGSIGTDCE
ncbi:hypothetical protein [Paraglaciecola sp. MB-3u-78]|uniref:hypothetical protein n=1 Tax=Paraglaciecola sp. MB-3u-78 TaxID=2058332 RepID=UPI000C34F6EA|nr:hypothetical protein [Paraglaciecola sp. MB-3u-78]PKG98527.1 hypothetical protein CXF95_11595 [Paraglaciecola sp. MB-3u-78]